MDLKLFICSRKTTTCLLPRRGLQTIFLLEALEGCSNLVEAWFSAESFVISSTIDGTWRIPLRLIGLVLLLLLLTEMLFVDCRSVGAGGGRPVIVYWWSIEMGGKNKSQYMYAANRFGTKCSSPEKNAPEVHSKTKTSINQKLQKKSSHTVV